MSHSSTLCHPGLKLSRKQRGVSRDRGVTILAGISPDGRTLSVNDADLSTMATALLERMYFCKVGSEFISPTDPGPAVIFNKLSTFRSRICRHVNRYSKPVSAIEFASMYRSRKRSIYEAAAEQFELYGVSKRDAHSSMFVKLEKVNPLKAPRCIQPRTTVYNVALGRYLKPIEHKIYRAVQLAYKAETPIVMKGFNVSEIGAILATKWEGFPRPVAIGLDATKFDMHVSHSMLKWEHSVYTHMFNNDPELVKLLSWQLINKGRGYAWDGSLKYEVRGRRFSGDMNTAMGNCLIMCAMIFSWARERNVHIDLANNGDDAVVFMNEEDVTTFTSGLNEWFLELGFRMTVEEPATVLEKLEFCQMHPVKVGSNWRMVRNFNSSREKDSMCLLKVTCEADIRKWMGAIGECGLALTSGVPVMQEFYKYYIRNGWKSNMKNALAMQSGFAMLSTRLESREETVQEASRVSFMEAFGVTPDEQIAMENYYSSLPFKWNGIETIDNLEEITTSPL